MRHFSKDILFLGNAWDLLSALMLEKAGFKAIGTTSWGIANSLGFALNVLSLPGLTNCNKLKEIRCESI
jgi:2-methylisocitrate lyase-like PEP mutase family enzyme